MPGGRTFAHPVPPAPPPSLECSAVLINPEDAPPTPLSPASSASVAPSSSPEFDATDAERDFSDVSSLRSYELNSDEEDTLLDAGLQRDGGTLRSSMWLEVGSGRESQHMRTDTTGSSWSSRSSVSASSVSASDGDALSPSPVIARALPTSESDTDNEDGEADDVVPNDDDSLGGSYADLEPSLHSDPSLSASTISRATADHSRFASLASASALPLAQSIPAEGRYELDFPDPATVSSSFSSSLASLPADHRPTRSPRSTTRAASTKHAFRPYSDRSARHPSASGRTDIRDRARGGDLTFGTSAANSFVSDATWGSFDTPTASILASSHVRPPLESAASVSKSSDEISTGLPERVRIILIGAAPSPAARERLVAKLLSLLAEVTPVDNGLVAVRETDIATASTGAVILRDVHRPKSLVGAPSIKGGSARAEVLIDDLTGIAVTTAIDDETDIDRYIRTLNSLAPSSILVVHLLDSTPSASSSPNASAASLSIGFLRFTLASSPLHLVRVLSVEISTGADCAGSASVSRTLSLKNLERLGGAEGCVSVWGGILQPAKCQVWGALLPEDRSMMEWASFRAWSQYLAPLGATSILLFAILRASAPPFELVPASQATTSPAALSTSLGATLTSTVAADVAQPTPLELTGRPSTTPLADEYVSINAEPVTSPVVSVAPLLELDNAIVERVTSEDCDVNVSVPRLPSEGRERLAPTASPSEQPSSVPASAPEPTMTLASDTAELVPTSALAPIFSLSTKAARPTFEPNMTQVVDAATILVNHAFGLVGAHTAVIFQRASDLVHSLAQGGMAVYQSLAPSLLRAIELAGKLRERGERVWKRVDTELWLAQRGASRLARVIRAALHPDAASTTGNYKAQPNMPRTHENATSLSHQLLHEVREAVHVASTEFRRSSNSAHRRGARVIADSQALGKGTLRDARRGLGKLIRKSEEMRRELVESAARAAKQASGAT